MKEQFIYEAPEVEEVTPTIPLCVGETPGPGPQPFDPDPDPK